MINAKLAMVNDVPEINFEGGSGCLTGQQMAVHSNRDGWVDWSIPSSGSLPGRSPSFDTHIKWICERSVRAIAVTARLG